MTQPFGGVTLASSIVVTTLAGVGFAWGAWKIAMDFSGNRGLACASYLLCLVLPQLWSGSLGPDSTLFYGAFVAWFLALFTVRFQSYLFDILALVCVAAVNLIRNDAILLLAPLLVVLWLRRRSGQEKGSSVKYACVMIVGYLLARIPMVLIAHFVGGSMSRTQSLHLLYLTDLSELIRYHEPSTLHTMLAAGFTKLIKLRITTAPLILYRMIFIEIGFAVVFLFPLRLRRRENQPVSLPELAGGASFALAVLTVYGLALPAIGIFSALRSLSGVLPLISVLIVLGIYRESSVATARKLIAAVVLFYAIAGAMDDSRGVKKDNEIGNQDRLVAGYLASHGILPGDKSLIMTSDPAQFSETTGYSSIPLPSNGLGATQSVARDLAPTHVLLHRDDGSRSAETEMIAALKPSNVADVPGTEMVVLTLSGER